MKFVSMKRPLEYPAAHGNIPKGATGVKIAFRQSPFTYVDKEDGKTKHLNVYIYKGRCYHA